MALEILAGTFDDLGQHRQAIEPRQRAVEIAENIGDQDLQMKALLSLGRTLHSVGQDEQALDCYGKSLAISRAIGNPAVEVEAAALWLTGSLLSVQGKNAESVAPLEAALEAAHKANNPQQEATVLTHLGIVYSILRRTKESIARYGAALDLTRQLKNRSQEADLLNGLAYDHFLTGNFEQSIELAKQALALAQDLHDDQIAGFALDNLSDGADAAGKQKAAILWAQERLVVAHRQKDRQAEAMTLFKLGMAYATGGDYEQAIASCRQGLEIASPEMAPELLLCLGRSSDEIEDFENAGKFLQRALSLAQSTGATFLTQSALDALAYHSRVQGLQKKADQLEEESSKIQLPSKDLGADYLNEWNLASACRLRGDEQGMIRHLGEALRWLDQSRDPRFHADDEGRASLLGLMAEGYMSIGETAKAVEHAERALNLVAKITVAQRRADALAGIGSVLFRAGRMEEAENILGRAVAEWEHTRSEMTSGDSLAQAAALDMQAGTYDLLQQALVARGKPEAALEVAERGRARAFVEALSARERAQVHLPALEAIRRVAKERNVTLVEYSVLYDPHIGLLPNQVRSGQNQLEKELFLWLIKPTGEIVFRRVDLQALHAQSGSSLAETVLALRSAVGGRGRGVQLLAGSDPNEPLRRLYDLLIAPIAKHLPSDPEARIVFVPQGPLFLVPFPALRAPSSRYLIEDHTILSAPSIDSLASIPRRPFHADWKPGEILVVGNPTLAAELKLEPYKLEDLPEAGQEAAAIAKAFGAQPLIAENATKDAILPLLSQRRLLHLATHGLLESGFGDSLIPGALVLAPGKDNGLMTAREILGLNLHADLAVLSACDTGRGRITSDGVIGLSRALLTAGVPNVVVSLWSIPDAPTSGLMQRFYGELKANPDPGRALRQAMLATMKDHPRPGDWAGFTLIGGIQ
jgi:tetratricopeptide (TPR) repeat protein